jgi:hypothetical protein
MLLGIAEGILIIEFGQQAYKPVKGLAHEVGQDWRDLHIERAEKLIWVCSIAGA